MSVDADNYRVDVVLYCIALHCIAFYCIVLYCLVLSCIVLYCIALYCIALHCITWHCIVLHCIVLHCIVLYLNIYIALLKVHTNQKRFQCERPREKRPVLRERKDTLGSPVNIVVASSVFVVVIDEAFEKVMTFNEVIAVTVLGRQK